MDSIVARSLLRQRASKLALTTAVAAVIALPAQADDLDVYRAQIAKQQKPNILFVLDYSSSMNRDINGEETDDSGLKVRSSVGNPPVCAGR